MPPDTGRVDVPFEPGPDHSPIVADGHRFTPDSIHRYRGADSLPRLEAVAPVMAPGHCLTIERGVLRVRTEPNAIVGAWAVALGTFANGEAGIVVRADATGLATLDVRIGRDTGGYPFYLASPARSGVVVITLIAE